MKKILWIEDEATADMRNLAGPLYDSGQYDLVVAFNASEGERQMMKSEFDAVVVDIRIPPGSDQRWIKLYSQSGQNKIMARLGLQLLYSLLKPEMARVKLDSRPTWITPERFGLLTVETRKEVEEDLKNLHIQVSREKTEKLPFNTLVEIIEDVLTNY
ncbi:MAG: hypothetical protein QG657_1330 [Acidobacteriota bacterium]|nr:hypothetical protein [Acidobacteriota bacterium]